MRKYTNNGKWQIREKHERKRIESQNTRKWIDSYNVKKTQMKFGM